MLRRSLEWSLIYILEGVAVLLTLLIFGAAALFWRLSTGPIELDFLRQDAQAMLAETFEGEIVALGSLEARYDTEHYALRLIARDVTVTGGEGEVITRAPLIEAGLALDALLFQRLEPVTIDIVGGAVSIVRRADGAVGAGLGGVERVAANARQPQVGGADSAWLFEILRNPETAPQSVRRLRSVQIEQASVRIVDDQLGMSWLVQDGSVRFSRNEQRTAASVAGRVATPSGFAPVAVSVEAGRDLENLQLTAQFSELSPAGVFPASGPLAALRGLDAPVDLALVVDATREAGIRAAALDVTAGEGSYLAEGAARAFEGAELVARFDPDAGLFEIEEAWILSEVMSGTARGTISRIRDYEGALPRQADFELELGPGFIDLGPAFERPPQWQGLQVAGSVALADYRLELDRLDAQIGSIRAALAGAVSLTEVSEDRWLPNIRLSGPIEGDITPELMLAYWPVELADGARDWIDGAILGADFQGAHFDLDLDAASIDAGALANERMTLTFSVENAAVRYISTMTPLTEARGTATLRGNAFEATLESGRIGNIEISEGYVDIPRLNPKGAMARYGGVARGSARDILGLIDEPPLNLASDYGLDPALVDGVGDVAFEIRRPMLSDVPPEDIPFRVEGNFTALSLALPGTEARLENGEARLVASQDGIEAAGSAVMLDTPLDIRWSETFGLPEGEASTRIEVDAEVSARTLDAFNLPARRYFSGPIMVHAAAQSDGLEVHAVDVRADLALARLEAPWGVWVKPPDVPGEAVLAIRRNEAGALNLDSFALSTDGMAITGDIEMGPNGRLVRARLPQVRIDGIADLEGELAAGAEPGDPLRMSVSGRYADVSDLLPNLLTMNSDGPGLPLSLDMDVGRLVLSNASVLEDFSLLWRSEAAGIRAVSLTGEGLDGPVQGSFGAGPDGGRREFRFQTQSVERLGGLLGIEGYASGGGLAMIGSAPPLGVDGPLTAQLEVTDLTLVELPILARLLAAGSFQGLAALLNGEGIHFDRVDAEILFEDGLLTIGEARARGDALGVTAAGTIDFDGELAAVDGNLVPSYGVNSMLGELPVIGELLVSRPGEGVIGITYSVEGPFDGLTVFANPLSVLAPGVLRRIFEGTAAARAAEQRQDDAALETPEAEAEPAAEPQP
ncbi:YhdP family protein [Maricaulis sp. CAU 1757]